jgi:hypothetical protein
VHKTVGDTLEMFVTWVLLIAFGSYIVRSWVCWSRSDVKLVAPRWRSSVSLIGFLAVNISLAVFIAVAVHAIFTGGLPYYHPVLILAFRVGFLGALLGSLAALVGKGQLDKPTIISSLLCFLIWFAEGLAQ